MGRRDARAGPGSSTRRRRRSGRRTGRPGAIREPRSASGDTQEKPPWRPRRLKNGLVPTCGQLWTVTAFQHVKPVRRPLRAHHAKNLLPASRDRTFKRAQGPRPPPWTPRHDLPLSDGTDFVSWTATRSTRSPSRRHGRDAPTTAGTRPVVATHEGVRSRELPTSVELVISTPPACSAPPPRHQAGHAGDGAEISAVFRQTGERQVAPGRRYLVRIS